MRRKQRKKARAFVILMLMAISLAFIIIPIVKWVNAPDMTFMEMMTATWYYWLIVFASSAFYDWQSSTFKAEDYEKVIYDKFSEQLDKYGVSVGVHSGDYNFNNTENKKSDYSPLSIDKKNTQSFKEVGEIAKEYGLDYEQAVSLWNKMNKQYMKMRDPLHPANFVQENEQ